MGLRLKLHNCQNSIIIEKIILLKLLHFPKNHFLFLNIKIRIMEKEGRRKEKRKLVTGLTYASIRTPTWYLA